jgi:hypothetical protein
MPSLGVPDSDQPYFLGRATRDTVLAGPGNTKSSSGYGHFGPGGSREIYGQVVEVDRVGRLASTSGVEPGTRVLVVPWDYDSACQPVPWSGTAAWLRTGTTRFFRLRLRPEKQWAGRTPTFDAFIPQFAAFPGDHADPVFGGSPARVPADSVFAFFEAIPAVGADPFRVTPGMLATAQEWADRHPALAREWPIAASLSLYGTMAMETRAAGLHPAIAGTWRLMVHLPGGEVRSAWLRTAERPRRLHYLLRPDPKDSPPAEPEASLLNPGFIGTDLECHLARTLDSLPAGPASDGTCHWALHVAWPDSIRSDGSWPGELETWEFHDFWGRDDAVMDRLFEAHDTWFDDAWDSGNLPVWSGEFDTRSDPMRFQQEINAGELGVIRIEGVKVSNETALIIDD